MKQAQKIPQLWRRLIQNKKAVALSVSLLVAVTGVALIASSRAGTFSVALEAESGNVTGNGDKAPGNGASGAGDNVVKFGIGTIPPNTNPFIAPGISKGLINDASNSTAADAADMKTLGIKWTRGWLSCGDANNLKASIQRLKDNGSTYLPTYNCAIDTSIADYKAKLAADMQVLMPLGIHVWEIGNEMNGGWNAEDNYCNNNATGDMQCAEREYTAFLKAAYETIHANDPQGVVVYGGLTNWSQTFPPWMEAMLSNPEKPWNYIDGFGFHPYGSNVGTSMASMDQLAEYMSREPAFATKPIWITEYGCWSYELNADQQSPCEPHNETGKAQYLVGMLNALKVWRKGTNFEIRTPVCWYIIHEPGNAIGYGLKSGDGTGGHVEAYDAYKNYSF